MNKKEVYQAIRFNIITNSIGPNEILNEKDLMERFKLGRSPLRDVLFKLQEEELLRTLPRLGYMTTPLNISEVRDLVEMRTELEGFAGFLAAKRITPSQLENLRTVILKAEDEMPEHYEVQNLSEYFDTQFHNTIYEASGNQKLIKILNELHTTMLRIWFHLGFKTLGYSKQAENFHEVMEALAKKDPVRARKAMEVHVEMHTRKIREKFL